MASISLQSSLSWINDSVLSSSSQGESDQMLLISSDGSSISLPVTVLLAISPLLREVISDKGCFCSTSISFPTVKMDVLLTLSEILSFGESSTTMELDRARIYLRKVQSVMDLLQIGHGACVGLKIASGHNQTSGFGGVGLLKICNVESTEELWSDSSRLGELENLVNGSPSPLVSKETTLNQKKETTLNQKKETTLNQINQKKKTKETTLNQKKEIKFFGCLNYSEETNDMSIIDNMAKSPSYTCSACWMNFEVRVELLKHVKTEHPEATHVCSICGARFIHEVNLTKHVKSTHLVTPKSETVPVETDLHKNVKNKAKKENYRCVKCKDVFKNRTSLKIHYLTCTQGKEFSCDYCSSTFKTLSRLERHTRNFHEVSKKKFQCTECFREFWYKGNWKRHCLTKHAKIRKESEKAENKSVLSDSVRYYPCIECNKVFSKAGYLTRHKNFKHPGTDV
eukprot:GFUD01020861.1.p1 GENE.GFUD01020861.1~~GFUD01020861.1.p1  ORF type:complete len:455 (+),score=81.94 GFUD01020861.1:46-1410(+)